MGTSGVHCDVRTAFADNTCTGYVDYCLYGLHMHSEILRNTENEKVNSYRVCCEGTGSGGGERSRGVASTQFRHRR